MWRLFARRKFIPFSYKLMISYILFVITPVAIVGIFAYVTSVQAHRERTSDNLKGTLQQVRDNILYQTEDVERISDQLFYNYNLHDYLRRYEGGWYSYETTTKYIMPTLESLLNYTRSNILLTLYFKNTTLPERFYKQDEDIDPMSKQKSYELFHLNRIEQEVWYREFSDNNGMTSNIMWRQVSLDEQYDNISLLRPLIDVQEWRHIGVIRITIKLKELLQSVDYQKFSNRGHLYVLDQNNETLFTSSSGEESPGIPISYGALEQDGYLMLEELIPNINWRIIAFIPNDVFKEHANNIRNLTLLICISSIIILSVISIAVSQYLTKRVAKIISTLNAFREGEFHKRIPFKGYDEFAQIASAFNLMGQNISELIQQVYVANLEKKEAELASLQAQINPHFLYNTLSSISRLAKFGEIDKLHQMVLGLARFYRLTLNEGNTIITVANELEQVMAYIDIQKIKYEDRMTVEYQIDSQVYGYDTVKLILQPFIENVLEHAWYGDEIHICIEATLIEDRIQFKVIDDGIGMNSDTINQIFSAAGVRLGYGIRNVDERIKLQFGDSYGIQMNSQLGVGTEVTITFPLFKKDQDAV